MSRLSKLALTAFTAGNLLIPGAGCDSTDKSGQGQDTNTSTLRRANPHGGWEKGSQPWTVPERPDRHNVHPTSMPYPVMPQHSGEIRGKIRIVIEPRVTRYVKPDENKRMQLKQKPAGPAGFTQ